MFETRPTTRLHPIRRRVEAAGLSAAVGLLTRLPEPAALALGERAGDIAVSLPARGNRIARANLRLVFPGLCDVEREALLREHLRQLGRSAVEWARLPNLEPGDLAARVEISGLAHLHEAAARGSGVLVATAHFGFWEITLPALRLGCSDLRVTAVAHAQRNPWVRAQIDARRRFGDGPEPLPQEAHSILRALAEGAVVGVLADHYRSPRRGGRLAPFLGHAAWTNPGPATLALRAGCPLLLAHTRPLRDGRHRIDVGPPMTPPASVERPQAIEHLTAALNESIEGFIRAQPQFWLWSHARFRGSPDIDAEAYERAVSRRSRRR